MKIRTASFYQVRFFDNSVIGLSTAMWDPQWFHAYKGQENVFFNENGFLCGLKAKQFILSSDIWQQLVDKGINCEKDCKQKPFKCAFMKAYRKMLDDIGIKAILDFFEKLTMHLLAENFVKANPTIVLLVHESPKRPCAERPVIWQFFKDNGIEVTEWERN